MSSAKHTPGPWVRCEEAPKIIMSGSFIKGHQGYIVGSVSGNDNSGFYASEQEAEANARLIVAAPEMLEALELAAETLRRYEDYHRAKNTPESLDKAIANQQLAIRLEAVIAKATS